MALKKRGLSSVVATVLILLMTVGAITLLAGYVIPFINKSLEGTSCFEFREYFKFENSLGYNCYDTSSKQYILSIRARGENASAGKLKGFTLRLLSETDVKNLEVKKDVPVGEILMFNGEANLKIPEVGGAYSALTYNYSSPTYKYNKAEVYAIITDEICKMSDSLKIEKCT